MTIIQPITETTSTLGCLGGSLGSKQNGGLVHPAPLCPSTESINSSIHGHTEPLGDSVSMCTRALLQDVQGSPPERLDSPRASRELNDSGELKDGEIFEMCNKKQITIGTFNIRGRGASQKHSKYKDLSSWMRLNRIAVVAVQETKLNNVDCEMIRKENPRTDILENNSENRSNGIAFVLNKDLTAKWTIEQTNLIPGRASAIKITHEKLNCTLVNVYSSNDQREKVAFYKELLKVLREKNIRESVIMLGDFNFVEDSLDRLPEHRDEEEIVTTFNEIKAWLNLIDAWRHQYSTERQYSYSHCHYESFARIDRIYCKEHMANRLSKWRYEPIGDLSDHQLVTCSLEFDTEIHKGKGLWRLPLELLDEPSFVEKCEEILKRADRKIDKRTDESAQVIWTKAKQEIKETAKCISRKIKKDKTKKLERLHSTMKKTLRDNGPNKYMRINSMNKRLAKESKNRIDRHRIKSRAKHRKESEKSSKYWYNLGKEDKEPATIYSLKNKDGQVKNSTEEMSGIAKDYFQNLMTEPDRDEDYELKASDWLDNIECKLSEQQKIDMTDEISSDEIKKAMKDSDNAVAPGTDGIPVELYKVWSNPKKDEDFSVPNLLEKVFNEIENKGLEENSKFNEGSMFLLFKKGDRDRIENYRPITLSNSDYKLMTKSIANRLGKVAQDLIHPNQTGFVPGRGLYNNTRLSEAMIEYTTIIEENGCILALDQEKAYDRIAHDYLWIVLDKFGFPEKFVQMIKILYKDVKTRIVVNGVNGGHISIKVGVKQGCPMSCLLYDLAIEPLACAIRKSSLSGFKIPDVQDKILVSMFADDTLIYLNEKDDLTILKTELDVFCILSNARFNEHKYEALPVGSQLYRKKVLDTRKLNDKPGNVLKDNIKLIKEGQSMRTLGAWIGHNTDVCPQWSKILEKQRKILNKWSSMNLSLKGKELILKALVTSRTLFLATVNGISNDMIREMNLEMRKFLWDDKRSSMSWDDVIMPREKGGLSIPDLTIRKDVIAMMWLKKWFAEPKERPIWAYVVDEIVFANVAKQPKIENKSRISWLLQSWHEFNLGNEKLPNFVKEMMRVARKYNIGFDALKVSNETKRMMPIWHHIAAENNFLWNKKASKCLRDTHEIKLVGDLEDFVGDEESLPICETDPRCKSIAKKLLNFIAPKFNVTCITPRRDNLDHTPRRIEVAKGTDITKKPIVFNPDVTARGHPTEHIRILGNTSSYKKRKTKDPRLWTTPVFRIPSELRENCTVYIKGKTVTTENNDETRIGLWFGHDDDRNKSFRFETAGGSYNPDLLALNQVLETPGPLLVKMKSKKLVEVLTRQLSDLEDQDWLNVSGMLMLKYVVRKLRIRGDYMEIQWHNIKDEGSRGLELMLTQAAVQLKQPLPDVKLRTGLCVEGARLDKLTQKVAYHLILRKKLNEKETKLVGGIYSDINMKTTLAKLKEVNGTTVTTESIWKRITKLEPKKFQDFVWKSIHGRIKCGRFFLKIPNMRERAYCICGAIESEEHIVFQCMNNHCSEIWDWLRELWNKATECEWTIPDISIVRGLGAINLRGSNKDIKRGQVDLYRTLVSLTVWRIWRNRNMRIFQESNVSLESVKETITNEIKNQISVERECVRLEPREKRAKLTEQFKSKWGKLIEIDERRKYALSYTF